MSICNIDKKFSELEYIRPDFAALQAKLDALTEQAGAASSVEALLAVIAEKDALLAQCSMQCQLAMIRCYLDASDPYYMQEMQATSAGAAMLDESKFAAALLASPYAADLDARLGALYLQRQRDLIRLTANGKELLAKCSQLENQYQQLKATLRIPFDGKEYSEGQLMQFLTHTDRAVRKAAYFARQEAFLSRKAELDALLEEMVNTRIAAAKANGFDRYVDYINLSKGRRSYGQAQLLAFCNQVKTDLVPLARKLAQKQAARLGLDVLAPWDGNMLFADGNPKPIGDGATLLEAGKAMYDDMDPEIAALYRTMADNGYIDVTASPNKISGMGFCTVLAPIRMPYIFGNCSGESSDAVVMTHEVGHAYQMRQSIENQPVPEYWDMPNDVVEIPSKAMEQFTSPYAEVFFGRDAAKFRYDHLQHVVTEICVFCATHEYEDWLYANPEAGAQQRIDKFNEISALYDGGTDRRETGHFAAAGADLYRSMGVFMFPGYVISYALSDMGALEFRARWEADPAAAWADYACLCRTGGSRDYDGLMEAAHLSTAYAEGAVARAAATLSAALDAAEQGL